MQPEPDPAKRNPRSLSIPKDPSVLYRTVDEWLIPYWPEERPGSGMNSAIRTWQGTIPGFTEKACALKRELEAGDYGKNGEVVRWQDLPFERQRSKIAFEFQMMQRAARG